MKSQQVRQVLFLGAVLIIGVLGLIQALHEDALAVPECSVVCICNPSFPCGVPNLNPACLDDEGCGENAGTFANCVEYCQSQ